MNTGSLAVLMLFSIPMVAVIGGLGIEALKIIKGTPKKGKEVSTDETEMMQELFRTASRMEKRIEALETLLLDRARDQERV